MNLEDEIHSLSAETWALQTLFAELCHGLIDRDTTFKAVLADVFDHAANFVEDRTIAIGKGASPQHTVKALRIVEELRTVVLGNMKKPAGGV